MGLLDYWFIGFSEFQFTRQFYLQKQMWQGLSEKRGSKCRYFL